MQTICPYTLQSLNSIKVNEEHIIPMGLGVPSNFTVPASLNENNRLNKELDSIFVNDNYIKFLAATGEVSSRSGPVSLTLDGVGVQSGTSVACTFTHNDLQPKVKRHITKNENGTITVQGYPEQLESEFNRLQKDFAKKGMRIEKTDERALDNEAVKLTMQFDLFVAEKSIAKIAYLYAVSVFGDSFINSTSAEKFRLAFNSETKDVFDGLNFQGKFFLTDKNRNSPFQRLKKDDGHMLVIVDLNGGGNSIFVYVSLFGFIDGYYKIDKNFVVPSTLSSNVTVLNINPSSKEITKRDIRDRSVFEAFLD